MSYLKDREIWLSNVPTGNPPAGYFWKFIQNGKVVVRDSSGNNQMMIATSGSQAITGSLTVTGGITGTVSSASYVEYSGVANKPALVSGSSQITYSGLTGIPSGIVSGSAQIASFGIFATTGSNGFNGNQSITGSLTVTGQVVAQTLNVQQVTSSVVYSSGSNVFGNSLANTQQFTGSVSITGSLNTSIAAFGSAASTFLTSDGGTIRSRTAAQTLSDIAALPLAGGTLTGPLTGSSAVFSGNIQLGTIGGGNSTATPNSINLTSTFSNTAGSNLKLKLFEDTGANIYGIGVSNNQMDFNVPSGATYRFYTGAATFASSITTTGLTTGTNSGSSVNITTNNNNGTSGSPLQTNVNFYGYNGNLNGQIRVDDISGTAQVGTMKFYTWNSGQVLALTLAQTGAATFSSSVTASGTLTGGGTNYLTNTSTGIGTTYQRISNTGGDVIFGINNSTGGSLLPGAAGYATVLYNNTATDISFGTNQLLRMTIKSDGRVYVGSTSTIISDPLFGVIGSGVWDGGCISLSNTGTGGLTYTIFSTNSLFGQGAGNLLFYNNNNGSNNLIIYTNGNYDFLGSDVSDVRLKQDIEDLNYGLAEIIQLSPKSYHLKSENNLQGENQTVLRKRYGFIAQEIQQILPDTITGEETETDYLGLDYNGVLAVAIKAIQEQQTLIESLKSRIEILEQ